MRYPLTLQVVAICCGAGTEPVAAHGPPGHLFTLVQTCACRDALPTQAAF
jgi:hypothetical protein